MTPYENTLYKSSVFLYVKCRRKDKAEQLAALIPHTRESRDVIHPLISSDINDNEIDKNVRFILLGE